MRRGFPAEPSLAEPRPKTKLEHFNRLRSNDGRFDKKENDSIRFDSIRFDSLLCQNPPVHTGVLDSDPVAAGPGHGVLDN